jgi:hypothetical protein
MARYDLQIATQLISTLKGLSPLYKFFSYVICVWMTISMGLNPTGDWSLLFHLNGRKYYLGVVFGLNRVH